MQGLTWSRWDDKSFALRHPTQIVLGADVLYASKGAWCFFFLLGCLILFLKRFILLCHITNMSCRHAFHTSALLQTLMTCLPPSSSCCKGCRSLCSSPHTNHGGLFSVCVDSRSERRPSIFFACSNNLLLDNQGAMFVVFGQGQQTW